MRILVLLGGESAEREISLASGQAVAQALASAGHDVWAWDPGSQTFPNGLSTLEPPGLGNGPRSWGAALAEVVTTLGSDLDIVFIALHGGAGEDGGVQADLESCGVPYTGSDRLASGLAMDKRLSKILWGWQGLPTPAWMTLDSGRPPPYEEVLKQLAADDPQGVVLKPIREGSSVGVSIVKDRGAWAKGVHATRVHAGTSRRILAEAFIPGREITVGILGAESLPAVEIVPSSGFYDYERKYTPGASEYRVPADLRPGLARDLGGLALEAFEVLGCRGFGRVDFRLDPQDRPFILEVNTVPGLTATSLLPKAARAAGLEFPALIEKICRLGREEARGLH
ncbi:MAG: D-alanine--D-alanine ligase [Candidatus Eisenbacteria bacterium]|nr:D-alanine--D-alanine ligase [Candidatus Eisenbacteria bacterium]